MFRKFHLENTQIANLNLAVVNQEMCVFVLYVYVNSCALRVVCELYSIFIRLHILQSIGMYSDFSIVIRIFEKWPLLNTIKFQPKNRMEEKYSRRIMVLLTNKNKRILLIIGHSGITKKGGKIICPLFLVISTHHYLQRFIERINHSILSSTTFYASYTICGVNIHICTL